MSKRKQVEYKLILPKGYRKQPLLGRNEWLEALRSGKYKQATGKLKARNGSMCCLGVACSLQGRLKWSENRYIDPQDSTGTMGALSYDNPLHGFLDDLGNFPDCVFVENENGTEQYEELASLNDEARLTFLQIADIIERVWKHAGPLPK